MYECVCDIIQRGDCIDDDNKMMSAASLGNIHNYRYYCKRAEHNINYNIV